MTGQISDTQLIAFLDGELDDAEAAAIEHAIANDTQLEARAARLAAQDNEIRNAFASVLDEPVPERLRAAVIDAHPTAQVIDLGAARERRTRATWGFAQFGAMAASLVIGAFAGQSLLSGRADAPSGTLILASADGVRVAGPLDAALSSVRSGQQSDLGELGVFSVAITFRTADDRVCRQFALRNKDLVNDAVACRNGDRWTVEALGRRPDQAGAMRTASGDAAAAVVGTVDELIVGNPLVGAAEAAALR